VDLSICRLPAQLIWVVGLGAHILHFSPHGVFVFPHFHPSPLFAVYVIAVYVIRKLLLISCVLMLIMLCSLCWYNNAIIIETFVHSQSSLWLLVPLSTLSNYNTILILFLCFVSYCIGTIHVEPYDPLQLTFCPSHDPTYHLAPVPFALLLRLSGTVSLLMSAHVPLS